VATGELLTRLAIWLALGLYVAAQATGPSRLGRWFSAGGWVLFAVHVAFAFQVHYGWSHATALRETAAQTEVMTGVRTGSGLYVNYLFGLVWLAEVSWWACGETSYLTRPRWVELAVRAFFLFMILNGAVVFVDGPQRWIGLALVAVLLYAWRRSTRRW
jgi:hypothetical protein